jgi:coenzyme F420-0:L-glutamate ligase/coenzyme F420-1:gamma-L-glutamate ligase
VRAALGVAPGSDLAEQVGIPSVSEEPVVVRVRRAVAVALAGQALDEGVGVDVGEDLLLVSGGDPVDRGILAARIGVALWGEGFASSIEPAAGPGAEAVTVRILPR